MPDFDKNLQSVLKNTTLPSLDIDIKAPKEFASMQFPSAEIPKSDLSKEEDIFAELNKMTQASDFNEKGVSVTNAVLDANKRYSAFNPTIEDYEDFAAYGQSRFDKAKNGVLKGLNLAATTVVGGFAVLGGAAIAPFTGRFADIWDNEGMRLIDKWNNKVDNEYLPNYYTAAEKNAAWYSTSNWMTTNFLFDKLVKNAGFAVGAMVGGNIINAGLLKVGQALGKLASVGATTVEGAEAFKIFTPLLRNTARAFSAGKNIEAAGILEKELSSIADISARSSKLADISKGINKFAEFGDTARRVQVAAYSTSGEAAFEALQTSNEYRNNLIETYKESHGGNAPTGIDLISINESSETVGRTSFFGNLALLTITEYAQLPHQLGSTYSSSRQAANSLLGRVDNVLLKDGKYAAQAGPKTVFGKLYNRTKRVGAYVFDPKEAGQEIGQYALQIGTENYFKKSRETDNADFWVDGFLYGMIGKDKRGEGVGALVSKEGIESGILGGITGGLMQIKGKYQGRKATINNTQQFIQDLNTAPSFQQAYKEKLAAANRGIILQQQEQDATVQGDKLEAKDLHADLMHTYLAPRIKYGRYDMISEDIKQLKHDGITEQGLASLKEQGLANINDTIQQYQDRLTKFEEVAKNTQEIYKATNLRFSGEPLKDEKGQPILNEKGQTTRKYSPVVIDKMVYAASKIANYDLRIPQVNAPLLNAGVNTATILESIFKNNKPNIEATDEALTQINNFDTTSDKKDELKTALSDVIELSLRRKQFIQEYDDIKAKPLNYANDFTSAEEIKDVLVDQVEKIEGKAPEIKQMKLEVGKEYSLAEPLRKEGSNLHLAPKITVLSETLGGEYEVKLPNGKITFITPTEFKKYNITEDSNDSPEMTDILNKVIDTVLKSPEYTEIRKELAIAKPENVLDRISFINSLDNQKLIDAVEKEFNIQAADLLKQKEITRKSQQLLLKNKEQLDKQQAKLELISGEIGTGNPIGENELPEEDQTEEGKLKSADIYYISGISEFETTANAPNAAPHVKNARVFLNNISSFKNRSNLRAILVTPNNETALGLEGLTQLSYPGVSVADSINVDGGFVAQVFIEQSKGKSFFVDKDGNRIKNSDNKDVEVGTPVNINQVIFQTMPSTELIDSGKRAGNRYRKGEKDKLLAQSNAWREFRKDLFTSTGAEFIPYPFNVSRGIGIKNPIAEKNHIGEVLIPNTSSTDAEKILASTPGIIQISISGSIIHKGQSLKFPKGRPVFQFNDTLQFLNNSIFGKAKATTIFQVIKAFAKDIQNQSDTGKPIELDVKLATYLQNVLYFRKSDKTSGNQIFIDTNNMTISLGDQSYPISEIANNEEKIITQLTNTYHNINKESLKAENIKKPFYEYIYESGKLTDDTKWRNYQSYLLSSKNADKKTSRSVENTPLVTGIAKVDSGVPYSFQQKYATLQGVDMPVQQVVIIPLSEETSLVGGYNVDGITPNTYKGFKAGDVEFTAKPDPNNVGEFIVTLTPNEVTDKLATPNSDGSSNATVVAMIDILKNANKLDPLADDKQVIINGLSSIIGGKLRAAALVVEEVFFEPETKKANWVNNLSNIQNELSKLKTKEEKLQWLADNDYLEAFTENGKTSLYLKTATNRVVVKIKIGNITIPFYISTGQGEKADVETNKWYVFFGQGKNGWFNKTSGKDINNQYDVKVFQDIASILNGIGSNKDEYKNHQDEKGFMDLKWTVAAEDQLQTVIDFITPVQPNPSPDGPKATPEQIAQLKQNIQTVKDRVIAELAQQEIIAEPIIEEKIPVIKETPVNVIKPGTGKAPSDNYKRVEKNKSGTAKMTDAEIAFFKQYAKEKAPQFPIEILEQLVDTYDNEKAYGVFEDGFIKFYKGAIKGTEYHELGEAIWNGLLTPEEQAAIIADEKEKGKTFVDRETGRTYDYATASDQKIKERIMDDFADYRAGKLTARSLGQKVLDFFKRIINFFKTFGTKPSLKTELFKAIDAGKFKEYKIVVPTVIKPGVAELFESNPELANIAYNKLNIIQDKASNPITRSIKEELPFKVIGDYSNIEEGLTGRRYYERDIDNKKYKFEISTYTYENDGDYNSFFDIDFTVDGSEELGSGFFDKSEIAKQIIQALLSVNYGNDTVRFVVEEVKKGKQRLLLYKRLMLQLGYTPSYELEYSLFYDIKTNKIEPTPNQKQQALQLYSQYLDTIFPDSKVKDIVYHATSKYYRLLKSGKFLLEYMGKNFGFNYKNGISFTYTSHDAKSWFELVNAERFISALVNVKNIRYESDKLLSKKEYEQKIIDINNQYDNLKLKAKDGNILFFDRNVLNIDNKYNLNNYEDRLLYTEEERQKELKNLESNKIIDSNIDADDILSDTKELVIYEPDNIHILGSKQDIEGFKEFMGTKKPQYRRTGIIEGVSETLAYYYTQDMFIRASQVIFGENNKELLYDVQKITGKEVYNKIKQLYINEEKYGGEDGLSETQFNQLFKRTKDLLRTISVTINEEETADINDSNTNNRGYVPEPFSTDWKKTSMFAIKLLAATNPQTKPTNQQNTSFLKLPERMISMVEGYITNNFSRIFATLSDKLSNTTNPDKMVEKLFDIAKYDANYVRIFKNIGGSLNSEKGVIDFSNFKKADWRFLVNFFQTFNKQRPEALIEYVSGNNVYTGAADVYTASREIQKRWFEAMKTLSDDPKSIISKNYINKVYQVKKLEDNSFPVKTPEEQINFLSAIGITFSLEDYANLKINQQDKFGKAVSDIRSYLESKSELGSLNGKTLGINSYLTTLSELLVRVTNPNRENTFASAEGSLTNAYADNNTASVFENEFNNVSTLEELLIARPELNDIFSKNNVTFREGGEFINEDGDKIKDIKILYISGRKDLDKNKGISTTNLTEGQRYTQEINQNLQGNYYILIPGESATQWMMNLGNSVSFEDFQTGRATKEINKIFRGYLSDDLSLALDYKNREILRNIGSKAKELRFFKDFLSDINDEGELVPSDFLTEINGLIADPEVTQKEIEDYIDKNIEEVNERIKGFIDNMTTNTKTELIKNSQVILNRDNTYSYAGIDDKFINSQKINTLNKYKLSENDLNNILLFNNTNYTINNIEFHKILFGDPYQFAVKNNNLEETKRIKSFLSTKRFMYNTDEFNIALNNEYNKAGEIELEAPSENSFGDVGYHEHKDYANTVTLTDIKFSDAMYDKINEADAQSLIIDVAYREVKLKNGQWSDNEAEPFHQWQMAYTRQNMAEYEYSRDTRGKELDKQDEELIKTPCPDYVLDIIKPLVAGVKSGKKEINLVLDKYSQMPLYFSAIQGTNLEKLYIKMWKEQIDYAIFESGRKLGIEKTHSLYTNGDKFNNEPFAEDTLVQVPWGIYGTQLETAYEYAKDQTWISQLGAMSSVNLFANGEPIGATAQRKQVIKKEYERNTNIVKQLHNHKAEVLLKKLGVKDTGNGFILKDPKIVSETLQRELKRQVLSSNALDTIELDENGQFKIPFEASPVYTQIKSVFYSMINKSIISMKMNGGSKTQASVALWENTEEGRGIAEKTKDGYTKLTIEEYNALSDDRKKNVVLTSNTLKFYIDENGKRICEIMLPPYFKDAFDPKKFPTEQSIMDYLNNLGEEGQEILRGIGARIPVQSMSSIEVFKVKKFLPKYMGDTVIVPSQITTKTNSDFDIDKLNTYLKSVYKNEQGNVRLIRYKGSEKATKKFYSDIFTNTIQKQIDKVSEDNTFRNRLVAFFNKVATLPEINRDAIVNLLSDEEYKFFIKYEDLLQTINRQAKEADLSPADYMISEVENKKADLTAKLLSSKLREDYVDNMYTKALQNEYYDSLEKLITLPENFKHLTSPVDDAKLSDVAKELDKLRGEGKNNIKNRILDRNYMSALRQTFLIIKKWVGIVAQNIKSQSLTQKTKVYINPANFAQLSKEDKAILGNGSILLPHNKVIVNGEEYTSISGVTTADGKEYISRRLSGYGTAVVDVVNNPFIRKIINSKLAVNVFMFLERIGCGERTPMFINQPIIKEYLQYLDGQGYTYLHKESNIKFIKNKFFPATYSDISNATLNVNQLEKNIGDYSTKGFIGSSKYNAEQQLILNEFLKYARMADFSSKLIQATNYDTSKSKSLEAHSRKKTKTELARETSIFSDVDNLLDSSYIGNQKDLLDKLMAALGGIMKLESPAFSIITSEAMRTYEEKEFMSGDDFDRVASKMKAAFLDYIIQINSPTLTSEIQELMTSKNSVADQLLTAQKKYPEMKLLQDLEIRSSDRFNSAKTIKLKVNLKEAYDENLYIEFMRELKEIDKPLFDNLVKVAILQGAYQSSVSIKNIIPVEDYAAIIKPIIDSLISTPDIKLFSKGMFQRTTWIDDVVFPEFTPRFSPNVMQYGDEHYPIASDEFGNEVYEYVSDVIPRIELPINIFGNPNDRRILLVNPVYNPLESRSDFIKVRRTQTLSNGDVIDFTTGQSIVGSEYRRRKEAGDLSLRDIYGYQKIYLDNKPVITPDGYHVYKLINLRGDGYYVTEHYPDFRPSVLNNGTMKIDQEIPDGDIIKYLGAKTDVDFKAVEAPASTQVVSNVYEKSEKIITRTEVKNNPKTLYIFGDNDQRKGLGGQAKEMRGEQNTVGISTKKYPSNNESSFKTDNELEDNKKIITDDINKVIAEWNTGKYNKVSVPQIGVGLAALPTRAPQTYAFLQQELNRLEKTVSTQAQIKKTKPVSGQLDLFATVETFDEIKDFTSERKQEILTNFASKHKMTIEEVKEYLNKALATNREEVINKLKDCY